VPVVKGNTSDAEKIKLEEGKGILLVIERVTHMGHAIRTMFGEAVGHPGYIEMRSRLEKHVLIRSCIKNE
jgi:hypothetical protein